MAQSEKWNVVLFAPGEAEVSLLADLSSRDGAAIVGVVDPSGESVGTAIAEVMGAPILGNWDQATLAHGKWLVHPAEEAPSSDILRLAQGAGMQVVTTPVFRTHFGESAPESHSSTLTPPKAGGDSVHRTLSRIEEALDRDSLLRWLLTLATESVGATEGSIMLLDDKTDELYVAFAYGLSEDTFLGTRVALGEGISGDVARKRRSQLICGRRDDTDSGDRNEITSAICSPLIVSGHLLGVLNVNVTGDERVLGADDQATIDRLAGRLAVILGRFLTIQRARATELFAEIDETLRDMSDDAAQLETILAAWSGTLAIGLGAQTLSLALACADGSLLIGEGTRDGDTRVAYGPLTNPAWREVFEHGRPLVVKQDSPDPAPGEHVTVFYLPIGHRDVSAVLTVVYGTTADAYNFNKVSSEYIRLLEQRLSAITGRIDLEDRLERMSGLAKVLGDIAGRRDEDVQIAMGRLRAGACRLTGAEKAYLIASAGTETVDVVAPDSVDDEGWLREAHRLLAEARRTGWRVTMLSGDREDPSTGVCLLAVPADADDDGPGIVLRHKSRVHQLDGEVFTAFDAELCSHLARLLPMLLKAQARNLDAEPAEAEVVVPLNDLVADPASASVVTIAADDGDDPLLMALRMEMDRADRYHSTFALNAFRSSENMMWDDSLTDSMVRDLGLNFRTSDAIFARPDGTILLLTPEDTQSLRKLHQRVVAILRDMSGVDYAEIRTSQVVYPGNHENAEALIAAVIEKLGA